MAAEAASGPLMSFEEIERLLSEPPSADKQMIVRLPAARRDARSKSATGPDGASTFFDDASTGPEETERLLNQAERLIESAGSVERDGLPAGIAAYRLEEFSAGPVAVESPTIGLIRDVELDVKIELGRTHMYLDDVLKLRKGSVVSLDCLVGDPVDICADGRLVARGEVLVLNDDFCVRVTELLNEVEDV
jgi:flagellar motor switch protein FliN